MGLRERAIDAWREKEKAELAYRQRANKRMEAKALGTFEEKFSIVPEAAKVDDMGHVRLVAEGMTFLYNLRVRSYRLMGTCSECGANCWSEGFASIERLGSMLEDFQPEAGHQCAEPEVELTAADNLRAAWRAFMGDEDAY